MTMRQDARLATMIGAIAGVLSSVSSVLVMIFWIGSQSGSLIKSVEALADSVASMESRFSSSQDEVKRAYESQVRFNQDIRGITAAINADIESLRRRMVRVEDQIDKVIQ